MTAPDFSRADSPFIPGEWLIRQGRSPSGRDSFSLCVLESVRFTTKDRPIGFLDSTAAPEIDGGPVIDMSGRVRGLYVSPPQAPAFVVPIERALLTAQRLIANSGRIRSSWLGLELQDLTEDLREYFGVQTGVLITRVLPDGPAARAGLQPSDIVQSLEDAEVMSASQLTTSISEKPPGTPMRLGIRRGTQNRTMPILTAPYPADEQTIPAGSETLTLKVEDTIPPDGPAIVDAGPPDLANRLGLLSGDLIKAVDGRSIRRSADLVRLLRAPLREKSRLFQIQRGERVFFVAIKETVRIDG
jgi:serine protease Do